MENPLKNEPKALKQLTEMFGADMAKAILDKDVFKYDTPSDYPATPIYSEKRYRDQNGKVIHIPNNYNINTMKIEYLYTEGKIGDRNTPIPVRLDGKRVGTIKPVEGGWQYFPINHKHGGEIFKTIEEAQQSLEFVDEE